MARKRSPDRENSLRLHVGKLLDWEDAHVGFEAVVEGIAPALRGAAPAGLPYSLWQLLEHLRRAQHDILEFCRNPAYVELPPGDYWPPSAAPPAGAAWSKSIAGFLRDREELKQLAADRTLDLLAPIPHGSGQTLLRELLLAADHNAYHVAQMIAVRRCLGIWRAD